MAAEAESGSPFKAEVAPNDTGLIGSYTKGGRERVQRRAAISAGENWKQQEQLLKVKAKKCLFQESNRTTFKSTMNTVARLLDSWSCETNTLFLRSVKASEVCTRALGVLGVKAVFGLL